MAAHSIGEDLLLLRSDCVVVEIGLLNGVSTHDGIALLEEDGCGVGVGAGSGLREHVLDLAHAPVRASDAAPELPTRTRYGDELHGQRHAIEGGGRRPPSLVAGIGAGGPGRDVVTVQPVED